MKDPFHPLVVSSGVGINSTALLCGLVENTIRPDLILFADTGGEKPETYDFLFVLDCWLFRVGFPKVTRVVRAPWPEDSLGKGATTLEQYCLNKGQLPSIAYGWKTCSEQWKARPQHAFLREWEPAIATWKAGLKVRRAIGYAFDEQHRVKVSEDSKYVYWHPLIEWQWCREECVAAITCFNLPTPPKSACFFCPSSTKKEIFLLERDHPNLALRAIAMERAAKGYNQKVKGLGRRFSWEGLLSLPLFEGAGEDCNVEMPCECYDGQPDDEEDDNTSQTPKTP